MAEQKLPLTGTCVVEIGHSLSAPYAGNILARLGARVIKIESHQRGDYARDWGPPFVDGASVLFHGVNNGKASVRANFDEPEFVQKLKAFILEHADVVLQNLKPGTLDRYGLGSAQLTAESSRLIYCNLGAFGRTGPLQHAPGYDPLMQAFSGLMSVIGNAGDDASRVPVSLNDKGTGMWAVIGILSALLQRRQDPEHATRIVDVSLFETALSWMSVPLSDRMAGGSMPQRNGSGSPNIVPYQVFLCADGALMIAAGNDKLFAALCAALELHQLIADPRFATNGARVQHRDQLIPLLKVKIERMRMAECLDKFTAASIPCGPMHDLDQVLQHAQTHALGILQTTPDGQVTTIGLPISFDGQRPPLAGNGPQLGANDDLLRTY